MLARRYDYTPDEIANMNAAQVSALLEDDVSSESPTFTDQRSYDEWARRAAKR